MEGLVKHTASTEVKIELLEAEGRKLFFPGYTAWVWRWWGPMDRYSVTEKIGYPIKSEFFPFSFLTLFLSLLFP